LHHWGSFGNKINKVGIFSKMGMAKRIRSESEAGLALDPKATDCMDVLMEFHKEAPGMVGGDRKK